MPGKQDACKHIVSANPSQTTQPGKIDTGAYNQLLSFSNSRVEMKTKTIHDCMIYRSYGGVGPPKPTCLEVAMGNNLVFRSPKPFFLRGFGGSWSMIQRNTEYSSLKVAICNMLIARVDYIQLIHIKKQMTLDHKSNPTKKNISISSFPTVSTFPLFFACDSPKCGWAFSPYSPQGFSNFI